MHIARCDMGIDDQGMHAIDGPMVQIEEPRRLVVAGHEAGVGINRADFDLLHRRCRVIVIAPERLLARGSTIRFDGRIQLGQVGCWRLFDLMDFKVPFVGVGL